MRILSDFRFYCQERLVPIQATLELTYRCNERCGHCYLATHDDGADGRPVLRGDEWRRVLDELAEAGVLVLILIGGEAMLHPDFWQIAGHAAERNFALTLVTNGLLIDDPAVDRFAELGFYQITLSLYSRDPEIHDRMTRRKGSHQRVLSAITRLRNRGLGVGLNCLLTKDNIDGYFDLEDWARSEGLRIQYDMQVTAKSDGGLASTLSRASVEQVRRFLGELRNRERLAPPDGLGDPDDPVCSAGRGKCAVNAYGDLLTCLEIRTPIGSLKQVAFKDLWISRAAEKLRGSRVRDLKFDSSCGDGAYCDHCPGMAAAETGDELSPVPFLMEIARIKKEVLTT